MANPKVFNFQTARMIEDYQQYFKEHPDISSIDLEDFASWAMVSHKMDPDTGWMIEDDIKRAIGEVPESIEVGLVDRLMCEANAVSMREMLDRYSKGENIDYFNELKGRVDSLEGELQRKRSSCKVEANIEEILRMDANDEGLHWRLSVLNRAMRPLLPGDFGIIAARPDVGKSTFIADQATFFAGQTVEGRPVIWLNNEGKGERLIGRLWQAALNATLPELAQLEVEQKLHRSFSQAVGGPDQIQVFDIHDLWSHEVEDILKQVKPSVVIFDMIDNVKFSGAASNAGQRTDQILENMYQWGRRLAVKYDCVVLATSQVSADGEGMRFPNQSMLKDSKTGKQGAADFILMIGKDNEQPDARFISLPKNKLARPTGFKDPRQEVLFDGSRSRYFEANERPQAVLQAPPKNYLEPAEREDYQFADDDIPF